ncbi:MAG: twin-arginine translocase TatA/TatE family subunit [Coriobacteriia bacterium]
MKFLQPQFLILIVLALVILFWPKRFPYLGRSFGKSMKAFREDSKDPSSDEKDGTASRRGKRKKA